MGNSKVFIIRLVTFVICMMIAALSMPIGFVIMDVSSTEGILQYFLILLPLFPIAAFCMYLIRKLEK